MFPRLRRPAQPRAMPTVFGQAARARDPLGKGSVRFVSLTKSFSTNGHARRYVVRDSNVIFPAGRKIALLGRNGAGKSTLMRVISGTQDIDSGQVLRNGSVSYPIGYSGSFHPDLTGAQNARFVARVHGIDTDAMLAYVHEFTDLGDFFFMPFRTYSSGMRARLAFGVSMCIPFDCYLVDEVTSVGDQTFRERCDEAFHTRLKKATTIMATHNLAQARKLCDMGAVLNEGTLTLYPTADEAVEVHKANLAGDDT